jgi:hypothetical protein
VVLLEDVSLHDHAWLDDLHRDPAEPLSGEADLQRVADAIERSLRVPVGHEGPAGRQLAVCMALPPKLVDMGMSIAIDRTRLVGVVIGAEPKQLCNSLAQAEAIVRDATPDARFGARSWIELSATQPPPSGFCVVSRGEDALAWKVPELERLKAACIDAHDPRCGGCVVLCIGRDDAQGVNALMKTLSDVIKDDAAICRWFCAPETGALDTAMQLTAFEQTLVDWLRSSLDVGQRDEALQQAERYRLYFTLDHQPLLDLVKLDYETFARTARAPTCRLAALSGAAIAGSWPALISAGCRNLNICQVLESLQPDLPLVQALTMAEPALRAVLGLITQEEHGRDVTPWFGTELERLRHGRRLRM